MFFPAEKLKLPICGEGERRQANPFKILTIFLKMWLSTRKTSLGDLQSWNTAVFGKSGIFFALPQIFILVENSKSGLNIDSWAWGKRWGWTDGDIHAGFHLIKIGHFFLSCECIMNDRICFCCLYVRNCSVAATSYPNWFALVSTGRDSSKQVAAAGVLSFNWSRISLTEHIPIALFIFIF